MWPFHREWPPNGVPLNRGSTVVSKRELEHSIDGQIYDSTSIYCFCC